MKHFLKLIYSFSIVFLTAYLSSYFTNTGVNGWYVHAHKTVFTPPNFFFPIIWTILYFLIAWSFYIILLNPNQKQNLKAHLLFLSQLFLNIIWCLTFFYKGQLGLALLVILLLDYLVFETIKSFKKINPQTSYFMYPYFAWLLYASFINLLFTINNGLIVVF